METPEASIAAPPDLDPVAAAGELSALFGRLRKDGRNDAALCVARAGTFLLGASTPPDVAAFESSYRERRPRRVRTPLNDAAWLKLLYHPEDDPYVGKVFEATLGPLRSMRARALARFGLAAREAANPATSTVALVRALNAASEALGVPMPLVFVRPKQAGGLGHIPGEPIASVAGAGLLSGRRPEELAFVAGHHMTFYRTDHYASVLCRGVPDLTTVFLAALKIGKTDLAVPTSEGTFVEDLAERVHTDPRVFDHLRKVVRLFLERSETVDIAKWVHGVERTALRAGLLLSGDLSVARSLVPLLPHAPPDALADLTTFAMSEAYFSLRQQTGLAYWPDGVGSLSLPPPAPDVSGPWTASDVPTSALRSVEISLDEIGAPPDDETTRAVDAFRSVEIPIVDLDHVSTAPQDAAAPSDLIGLYERRMREDPERARYVAALRCFREGSATPSEVRIAAESLAHEAWEISASLDEGDWDRVIRDAGEFGLVGALMQSLVPVLRKAMPRTPEDYGLASSATLDNTVPMAAALRTASRLLGTPAPLIFALEDSPALLARPPCDPPVTLVAVQAMSAAGPNERLFCAAEHLAYFRTERIARVLVPTVPLIVALIEHLVRIAGSAGSSEPDAGYVRLVADALERDRDLRNSILERAAALAGTDLPRAVLDWCAATERTAARAALFAVCDLDAARSVLEWNRGSPSAIAVDEKLEMLAALAITPAFADARDRAHH